MSDLDDPDSASVLAGLPSTRPQRRSPKRDSAKTPPSKAAPPKPATPDAPAVVPQRRRPSTAAQGFEPLPDPHGAVDPPSRSDLLVAVVHGAGDLAKGGLTLSRHLLRAVLGRLPLP